PPGDRTHDRGPAANRRSRQAGLRNSQSPAYATLRAAAPIPLRNTSGLPRSHPGESRLVRDAGGRLLATGGLLPLGAAAAPAAPSPSPIYIRREGKHNSS